MSNVINIKDLQPGQQVTGIYVEDDDGLVERPYTWGTPWTVLRVEESHVSEPVVYRGIEQPARTWFRVYAAASNGFEQSIGLFGEHEGLVAATPLVPDASGDQH